MKILIVAATKFEIDPLLKQMEVFSFLDSQTIIAKYKKLSVDFLITGVGMVATTYYVSKKINSSYNFAFNVGICGSFNNNLENGSVVNVYEDCFSELGAEDENEFLSLEDLKLEGLTKITNSTTIANKTIEELPKVTGITVNTVHGNDSSIEKVFNKFHPYVESMEGAAFMFVCNNEKIPYVQIRAVSNLVERRNKNNWNIPLAIENLNHKMLSILNELN